MGIYGRQWKLAGSAWAAVEKCRKSAIAIFTFG
jgi:hypothetical protein